MRRRGRGGERDLRESHLRHLVAIATWNVIQGNFIGTKADGSNALGRVFHNVELESNAVNNTIGGPAPWAGNRIAFAQSI